MTKSIMIVDDSPDILSLYSIVLEKRGYRVLKALDGASALEMLEDSVPDLFILDIMMPQINGVELCQRIRALPEHKQTPVIFLSAYSDTGMVEQTFAAGANDFVRKPVDAQELEIKICDLLKSTETSSQSGGDPH